MKDLKPPTQYIGLTAESNAFDYLEEAYEHILRLHENEPEIPWNQSMHWKWIVIGLHGALYGFAVCACRGTTNDRVVKMKEETDPTTNQKRTIEGPLIGFDEALKMCKKEAIMSQYVHSKKLTLVGSQSESIKLLSKTFRNNFEHMKPGSYGFYVGNAPKMCIDVLEVIRFLVIDSGNVLFTVSGATENFDAFVLRSIAELKKL